MSDEATTKLLLTWKIGVKEWKIGEGDSLPQQANQLTSAHTSNTRTYIQGSVITKFNTDIYELGNGILVDRKIAAVL